MQEPNLEFCSAESFHVAQTRCFIREVSIIKPHVLVVRPLRPILALSALLLTVGAHAADRSGLAGAFPARWLGCPDVTEGSFARLFGSWFGDHQPGTGPVGRIGGMGRHDRPSSACGRAVVLDLEKLFGVGIGGRDDVDQQED